MASSASVLEKMVSIRVGSSCGVKADQALTSWGVKSRDRRNGGTISIMWRVGEGGA